MIDLICLECEDIECPHCDSVDHIYEGFVDQEEYRCPCCDSPDWEWL